MLRSQCADALNSMITTNVPDAWTQKLEYLDILGSLEECLLVVFVVKLNINFNDLKFTYHIT